MWGKKIANDVNKEILERLGKIEKELFSLKEGQIMRVKTGGKYFDALFGWTEDYHEKPIKDVLVRLLKFLGVKQEYHKQVGPSVEMCHNDSDTQR